ncbi:Calpain-3 [Bulinus truncatus]|nr:Calpain-3 [Bulinus truncatus]
MAETYDEIKKRCLKSKTLFEDPKFPANSTVLFRGGPRYGVKWLRPKEIVKNPQFIADGFVYNDFDQGSLGNCWFIASVACLTASNHKEILKRFVPQDQNFDKDYCGSMLGVKYFWRPRFQLDLILSLRRFQLDLILSIRRFQLDLILSLRRFQLDLILSLRRFQLDLILSLRRFQLDLILSLRQIPS